MALYSTGGTSIPDIFIVTYLLIVLLASLFLNSFIYRYNQSRPRNIASFLFKTQAVFELLSNMVIPINTIVVVLPEGETRCKQTGQFFGCGSKENVGWLDTIPTIIGYPLIIISPGITALLAICRYLQIIRPFMEIKLVLVKLTIVIFVGSTYAYLIVIFVSHSIDDIQYTYVRQAVILISNDAVALFVLGIAPYLIFELVAAIASILTVYHLYQTTKRALATQSEKNSRRSSIKIVLMNLNGFCGCMACVVALALGVKEGKDLYKRTKRNEIIEFACWILVPSLLSVINPIIFLLLTPHAIAEVRNKISSLNHGWCSQPDVVPGPAQIPESQASKL